MKDIFMEDNTTRNKDLMGVEIKKGTNLSYHVVTNKKYNYDFGKQIYQLVRVDGDNNTSTQKIVSSCDEVIS